MNEKAQELITNIKNLSDLRSSLNHLLDECPRIGTTLYKNTLKKCEAHLSDYKKNQTYLGKTVNTILSIKDMGTYTIFMTVQNAESRKKDSF